MEGRETEKLDCLIFNVSMLHRLLLSSDTGNEILEAVGVGLSLLEEVHHAQTIEYCGYTSQKSAKVQEDA